MKPEEITEIFARELYVYLANPSRKSRVLTRGRWYLGIKAGVREQYRQKAADLIASLRESEIELVHETVRERSEAS